ncbi:MAG: peptidylprolyl isomerase [Acidobacteria bacterium]|nr:peptidylprolyl isomerase [Acidobacteriota bacterium]
MRQIGAVLWVLGVVVALGCGRPTATAPNVVARLGEHEVTYADFEDYLQINSLEGEVGLASTVLSGLFDQFLLEELLLASAREQGLVGHDRRRIVDQLIQHQAAEQAADGQVDQYYREHPQEFHLQERVDLRQILVDDRARAVEALERLRRGEAFEQVARSVQGEESGEWEQSDLTRDGVPPAFAEAIFSLGEGEVSEIVEADYGFFIFQVTRRQREEQLSLRRAAPRIRRKLELQAADRALSELVAAATERYNVAVFAQNLPFDYQGNYRRSSPAP